MNADGSGIRRLTHASRRRGLLSWSPDGRKIAFASLSRRTPRWAFFVMNADGSGVQQGRLGARRAEKGAMGMRTSSPLRRLRSPSPATAVPASGRGQGRRASRDVAGAARQAGHADARPRATRRSRDGVRSGSRAALRRHDPDRRPPGGTASATTSAAPSRTSARGRRDSASVGARVWDTMGVTSLRALVAPFLVDSLALERRVLESPLAAKMLAGLDRAGVVGLALHARPAAQAARTDTAARGPQRLRGGDDRRPVRPRRAARPSRALGAKRRRATRAVAGRTGRRRARLWRRSPDADYDARAPRRSPRTSSSGRDRRRSSSTAARSRG